MNPLKTKGREGGKKAALSPLFSFGDISAIF
jgi:hypothetical protein